jgi:multiple sugar transport system permease protein
MAKEYRKNIYNVLIYVLLILFGIAFLTPFVWMVSTSLMLPEETMRLPPKWFPSIVQWHNYPDAIHAMGYFWRYDANTLVICTLSVIGTVVSSSLAAYGFSRIEWRGRDKIFLVLLATMMIPFPVVMVPLYALFKQLGLIGSFAPLWIPAFFAGAFNVFLLRQFFMTLPKEMSEAARIDGCSEFQIFWRIVLPLSKPALIVVALFQFMYSWNDFLGPLIFLTEQKHFTLALGLQSFQSQSGGTSWHHLMAAATMVVLPVLVIFFLAQKTFIEGISTTGGKN